MELIVIIVFILGYLGIALEHNFKVDKLIPALAMMAICWAIVALGGLDVFEIINGEGLVPVHEKHGETPFTQVLLHHLGKTAEILVFLIGAMTIVEIIDTFDAFSALKRFVKTKSKRKLLWIIAFLAFILSAIIDNLTATIVLITILRKLVPNNQDRIWYASLIIIAANAGGAWSPIGDVTTTMLWIAHKVEVVSLIKYLLIPSLICMVVPVFIASYLPIFKGKIEGIKEETETIGKHSGLMLVTGLGMIIFVPIFKTITHLPPYIGMMLSLAIVAAVAELITAGGFNISRPFEGEGEEGNVIEHAHQSPTHHALTRIEMPSILFFLGILMAVAALESLGTLFHFAENLEQAMPMMGTELAGARVSDIVVMILGAGSAVIDNVPLVAASIGMFSETPDSPFWHFVAYAAGTGGSMLIIGSAAGVVAMGMEKINFFWYLKKIAWLALAGYIAGTIVFFVMRMILA